MSFASHTFVSLNKHIYIQRYSSPYSRLSSLMEDKFKLNKTSLMQKIQLLRIAIANLSVYTVSRQLGQYSAVIKFAFYYFTHAFLISKKKSLFMYLEKTGHSY